MSIKDIEIEIRNGKVKPEDIINEVTRVQKAIDKEKADKRAKEVAEARNDIVASLLNYMEVLGYGPADSAEEEHFIKIFEDALNDIEDLAKIEKCYKKPTKDKIIKKKMSDAEIDKELSKLFKMYFN